MDSKFIAGLAVVGGLFWFWSAIKSWWENREINKIKGEDLVIIKARLASEAKIDAINKNIDDIMTNADGKSAEQIEDFWAKRK